MITEITKAQLLALRVGQLMDEGKVNPHKFLWQKETM